MGKALEISLNLHTPQIIPQLLCIRLASTSTSCCWKRSYFQKKFRKKVVMTLRKNDPTGFLSQPFIFACMLSSFNWVWLFVILWTVTHQAPLSMGFSRQEYWSELPCPPSGDLPDSEIKPKSPEAPALQAEFLLLSPQGTPVITLKGSNYYHHFKVIHNGVLLSH